MTRPSDNTRPGSPLALNRIIVGDARTALDPLPSASIDTVITSPPYFRLRNYQHDQQIGLERHVDDWVNELLVVVRGLRRVLKETGSLWLNLGDSYSRSLTEGALPKSLVLAPERVAIALVQDGCRLRNKVIWAKSNPMPTSVRDRLSCTWEVVYFFTVSQHYFFDLDAIRVQHGGKAAKRHQRRPVWSVPETWRGPAAGSNGGLDRLKASGMAGHPLGKNPGDVWTMATAAYRGAHHAVYPIPLIEPALLATCPAKVCGDCGRPWRRRTHQMIGGVAVAGRFQRDCRCSTNQTRPGVVLDPFIGSGTTAIAAERHSRDWLGVELHPRFAAAARRRIADDRARRHQPSGSGGDSPIDTQRDQRHVDRRHGAKRRELRRRVGCHRTTRVGVRGGDHA